MKELFLIKDTQANRISYYHLMLLLLSLPFDLFYSHIILISLAVHTLIHFNKNTIKPVFTWRTVALQAVFFVTLISTIYTINPKQAFVEWELAIPVVVFPLLFCFNPLDLKKYLPNLLLVFALGCTATVTYLYIDAFTTIWHYHLPLLSIFSPAFTNQNFSQPIDMHATFFSLQVAISLVYLLSGTYKRETYPKQQITLWNLLPYPGSRDNSAQLKICFCGFVHGHQYFNSLSSFYRARGAGGLS